MGGSEKESGMVRGEEKSGMVRGEEKSGMDGSGEGAYITVTGEGVNKRAVMLTSYCVSGLAVTFLLLFLLLPRKDFSEGENRGLASFPGFTINAVRDGSFMKGLELFLCDHFPFRDQLMVFWTETEILKGKRKINGVYLSRDGYLIEDYEAPRNTERIIRQFAKFADAVPDRRVSIMLVPTAVTVYGGKLPAGAVPGDQRKTMRDIWDGLGFLNGQAASTLHPNLRIIDCSEALFEGGEGLYYRTDHHWTTKGAYAGYAAWCGCNGLEPVPRDAFRTETVTEDFRGTVFSKVQDVRVRPDSIELYYGKEDVIRVEYPDSGESADSLYNLEYLEKRDKYSLFLNNIHPFVEITNEAVRDESALCVIKDSYANSIIPFLAEHFRKIYVFDTRYYRKGPSSFLREHADVKDVLVLYNMGTIDTDLGIGGIF